MKTFSKVIMMALVLPLLVSAAMLTIRRSGREDVEVDVTGWIRGEDFLNLNSMYLYPWNGETVIEYTVESGLGDLQIDGKMMGLMLFNEYTMAEPQDTADIITVNVTADYLDELENFPNLIAATVMFMNEKVDFSVNLGKLTGLRALEFNQCTVVDDTSLEQLEDLKELRYLNLVFTKVSDEGLKTVGQFRELRELWLTGTQITDQGIKHLSGLKNLRELWLNQTGVSEEAVTKLQMALPDCWIVYE
ncbi:hypothetical protein JXM67_11105 [candidate division WOR-3 bacterium]|nr:hypothetical protein [candidate division WOR-3 bacterium]